MDLQKADLIIHPVRLRILQALSIGPQTTHQISEQLPDVALSSLYRHLRVLLDSEIISVAETHLVQGIQEKVYEIAKPAHLSQADLEDATIDDHLRFFLSYIIMLLQEFAGYMESTKELNFENDFVGYSARAFWASDHEMKNLMIALVKLILPLMENQEEEGKRLFKLALVSHPLNVRNRK